MNTEKIARVKDSEMPSGFTKKDGSFRKILQTLMQRDYSSSTLRLEFDGLLIPVNPNIDTYFCKYKLDTGTEEIFLRLFRTNLDLAKKMDWDNVNISGYFDFRKKVFYVDKIKSLDLVERTSHFETSFDSPFDINNYKKLINKYGKIELSNEFIVS